MGSRPIVVGVDGSEGSHRALEWAAGVASSVDSPVLAIHAYSPWTGWVMAVPPFDMSDYRRAVEQEMNDWCGPIEDAGVSHGCSLVEEDAATALLDAADLDDARMIVVGAHGHSRWSAHLLGSVTAKLLHRSPVPLAVIPQEPSAPVDGGILCGVDGSAGSATALRWAAGLASETDDELRAASVVPLELWHEQPFFGDEGVGDVTDRLRGFAERIADETGVPIKTEVLTGDPGGELVALGDRAGLLVVGDRGHTSVGEIVFGSVSRHCATHATRPVVVVPVRG
jgi:nucleotide-binding universal stress UspA family protein